jgi:hypothetical protein
MRLYSPGNPSSGSLILVIYPVLLFNLASSISEDLLDIKGKAWFGYSHEKRMTHDALETGSKLTVTDDVFQYKLLFVGGGASGWGSKTNENSEVQRMLNPGWGLTIPAPIAVEMRVERIVTENSLITLGYNGPEANVEGSDSTSRPR